SSVVVTGTTATTSLPSTSARSVLKTCSGGRPSASAASRPYPAGVDGSCSYGCTVCGTPARVSATSAGVRVGTCLARRRGHAAGGRAAEPPGRGDGEDGLARLVAGGEVDEGVDAPVVVAGRVVEELAHGPVARPRHV